MTPFRKITLTLTLVLATVAFVGTSQAKAKNLGKVVGPNGIAWAVALDCGTTEPFWDITISTDGVYLRELDGPWVKLAAQPSTPKTALRTWKVFHPDGRIGQFTLLPGPGSDGASDRTYAYRLQVSLSGSTPIEGACDRFPDGARPARVVNVASNDALVIRSGPSIAGTAVTTVGPGGYLWKKLAPDKGNWVPVFSSLGGESGEAQIVSGWVNDNFLDRLR